MGNSAERAREIINEIRADAKSDEGPVLFDRDHFVLPGYVIREAMAAQQGVVNLLTALDKARDERDEAQKKLAAVEGVIRDFEQGKWSP